MHLMNKSFITTLLVIACSSSFAEVAAPNPDVAINAPNSASQPDNKAQQSQPQVKTENVSGTAAVEPEHYPQTTTNNNGIFNPEDRPPQSGLGLQMEPAQVVYPSPQQVTEDSVTDLEELQLTPAQMNRLKQLKQNREKAKATPYVTPAKPITRTMFINLNAGVSPPTLRLSRGQLSTIVFSDANGQPWYISKVSINCTFFSTDACNQQTQQTQPQNQQGQAQAQNTNLPAPTNILTVEPMGTQSYGNVTVSLNGLPTPVIFILTSGQAEVDMRVDAKIPGKNPDSQYVTTNTNLPGIDDSLTSFLDGVPPKEARRLKVTGMDGAEAWEFKNFLYVRANGDALYPAYTKSARSTTGLSIYRFDELVNSVTFTTGGRAITAFIENKDN